MVQPTEQKTIFMIFFLAHMNILNSKIKCKFKCMHNPFKHDSVLFVQHKMDD